MNRNISLVSSITVLLFFMACSSGTNNNEAVVESETQTAVDQEIMNIPDKERKC